MAATIRLQRAGTKNRATYRIVATDSRKPAKGGFLEKIGIYDPVPNPPVFRVDPERLEHWKKKGARLSDTVASLLKRLGMGSAPATNAAEPPAPPTPPAKPTRTK